MMLTLLLTFILAQTGSDATWLLILGPIGGGATYFTVYTFYRNTNKSHAFERETRVETQPVKGSDTKVNTIRGTTQSYISGDNRHNHRQRVQRG